MAETLPMLETDPRPAFKVSRGLRVLAFSVVTALVLVSTLIVVVRFFWDKWLAPLLNKGPYDANPLLVVPAIAVIAALFAKVIWDAAEGRQPRGK
jgi:hypothetical protein